MMCLKTCQGQIVAWGILIKGTGDMYSLSQCKQYNMHCTLTATVELHLLATEMYILWNCNMSNFPVYTSVQIAALTSSVN